MISEIEPQILIGAGIFLGGVISGIFGGRKLVPESSAHPNIEKSHRTSGALHISEEALQKIGEINDALRQEYLTRDRHEDLCGAKQADMYLYISKELKAHTREILDAIKQNGHGYGGS
jgi:hypothetical protein